MFTPQRLLMLFLAALVGMSFGTTAADAAPRKHKFEVTFKGQWGVLWYVKMADGEPHHNCLTGTESEGAIDLHAFTKHESTVKTKLYVDKKGSFFGAVPVQAVMEREFTMGDPPAGCEEDHAEVAPLLDCDQRDPRWGRAGGPPAFLDIAGGSGRVQVGVRREQASELIRRTWKFCPFWGRDEGKIGGRAKLSKKKLFSGKTQTVTGYQRQDVEGGTGDGTHTQEGFQKWKLKIRYVKPKPKKG